LKHHSDASPLAGWMTWAALSVVAAFLISIGSSYPAQLFRTGSLWLLRPPMLLLSKIPQRFDLAQENHDLRQRTTELFIENCRLRELALESERLQDMIGLKKHTDMAWYPARVIGRGSSLGLQTLVLDFGLVDGLRGDEALITPWGLAGSLMEPGLHHSRAMLLTHREFRVRALIQRTRDEGILAGNGDHLALWDIPLSSEVQVGDVVVTSGMGSRFPGGIPIGEVTSVQEDGGLFKLVDLTPMAPLARLEEVFIVHSIAADSAQVAADGQRLLKD
jgi:rod shape-determining protein MreC